MEKLETEMANQAGELRQALRRDLDEGHAEELR
jgi:hypothetical protein